MPGLDDWMESSRHSALGYTYVQSTKDMHRVTAAATGWSRAGATCDATRLPHAAAGDRATARRQQRPGQTGCLEAWLYRIRSAGVAAPAGLVLSSLVSVKATHTLVRSVAASTQPN